MEHIFPFLWVTGKPCDYEKEIVAIKNCGISKRASRLEATIEAGYDISSNVAEMEQIYYSMYENAR